MSDGWDRSTVDMPGGVSLPAVQNKSPDRLGRYEITEPIAGGGMGFVYAAYDPELDRKVALKVVHPRRSHNPGSHSRLIKEARALARLDHPNVVKVHDVFSHDEQIVVVMELVAGETLADWEAAKPRTWREIVDVYAQAGDGLAAAHALEIVHRDFKPQNAIIGTDGRVRVLDFGLARMTADDVGESDDPAASGAITQTVPGAVMGTPAYSAPEQLEGGVATLASDQFSFCVALHRALEGKAPFAGESISALVLAIRSAPPATSDRAVPVWLRALVQRGLEPNPTRRHPSMDALLIRLKKPRGWKRWRWPAVVAFLVATAGVTSFSIRGDASSVVPCDGGEIATVWDPASRLAVGVAIERVGTPYAHEVADKVLAGMDSHARAWRDAHRGACMVHRGGAASDAMFDRETSCLAQRLGEIKSAVSVLERTTQKTLSGAADVAAGVHDAQVCMDVSRLLNDALPPRELRARVVAVRDQISTASAFRRAGRMDEAEKAVVAAIDEAKATRYAQVLAEGQLELGRILVVEGAFDRAVPVLKEAIANALANTLIALAVEGIARKIFVEGQIKPDVKLAVHDFEFAEALSRSSGADHFGRALLLNNVGTVFGVAQRPAESLEYYKRAREEIKDDPSPDLELTTIDLNIGETSPDPLVRVAMAQGVAAHLSSILGDHHPSTLFARFAAATLGVEPNVAYNALKPICEDYRQMRPSPVGLIAGCDRQLALLAEVLGDVEARKAALARIVATDDVESVGVWKALAAGELAIVASNFASARSHLSGVISVVPPDPQWWDFVVIWEAQLYRAQVEPARDARRDAHAALEGFKNLERTNFSIELRLRAEQAEAEVQSIGSQPKDQ